MPQTALIGGYTILIRVAVSWGVPLRFISWDDVTAYLGELRALAGNPSFSDITATITAARRDAGMSPAAARVARTTVYDAFKPGRRKIDTALVLDLARVLGLPDAQRDQLQGRLAVFLGVPDAAPATADTQFSVPEPDTEIVGRESEIRQILEWADPPVPATVTIAITGFGGSGKTRLARSAAAALVASGRVEGVLEVDMRAYDAASAPLTAEQMVHALLTELGVKSPPPTLALTKTALARLLTDRPMAVIIDNIAHQSDVAALLPRRTSTVFIAVSRERCTELGTSREMPLPPLAPTDARTMLAQVLGPELMDTDPDAIDALVELAGGIPLSLTLIGARITSQPAWTLADHVSHLQERRDRGRLDGPIALALDSAYTRLSIPARRLLRLLAIQPIAALDVGASASIAGVSEAKAAALTHDLSALHLVALDADGDTRSITLHDVIRTFASDQSWNEDTVDERTTATDNLIGYFLDKLRGALDVIGDYQELVVPPIAAMPDSPLKPAIERWLRANRANLMTLARLRPEAAAHIAVMFGGWLESQGHHVDSRDLSELAVTAFDTTGITVLGVDPHVASARFRSQHAVMQAFTGFTDEAATALRIMVDQTDPVTEPHDRAGHLHNLALAFLLGSRHLEGIEAWNEAITLSKAIDPKKGPDRPGISFMHVCVSQALVELGRPAEAVDMAEQGVAAGTGSPDLPAFQSELARALLADGRIEDAVATAETSVAGARTLTNRWWLRLALPVLAECLIAAGRPAEAWEAANESFQESRLLGDIQSETDALLARTLANLALGDIEATTTDNAELLTMGIERGRRYTEARSYEIAAALALHRGDTDAWAQARSEARRTYASYGARAHVDRLTD